jgi:uncharacterized small protein (DUF1192 family)
MREDDEIPLAKRIAAQGAWPPVDLSPLSVDELRVHIRHMQSEIARLEAAIGAKQNHLDAAASLFKR